MSNLAFSKFSKIRWYLKWLNTFKYVTKGKIRIVVDCGGLRLDCGGLRLDCGGLRWIAGGLRFFMFTNIGIPDIERRKRKRNLLIGQPQGSLSERIGVCIR